MKIGKLDWKEPGEGRAELRCPLCRAVWQVVAGGEESEYTPCRHLRLAWGEYGAEYFGDWDQAAFERDYRTAAAAACGEACADDEEAFDAAPDRSALETMRSPGIDELFALRDEIEGGETIDHYFGVKR